MHVLVEYTDEEPHEILMLKDEHWGLLSKSSKSEPSRAGSAADRPGKEAKKKAEQEELEKVKLGDAELSSVLHFKHLGVMQSSDGGPLVAVNHRIAIFFKKDTC